MKLQITQFADHTDTYTHNVNEYKTWLQSIQTTNMRCVCNCTTKITDWLTHAAEPPQCPGPRPAQNTLASGGPCGPPNPQHGFHCLA